MSNAINGAVIVYDIGANMPILKSARDLRDVIDEYLNCFDTLNKPHPQFVHVTKEQYAKLEKDADKRWPGHKEPVVFHFFKTQIVSL